MLLRCFDRQFVCFSNLTYVWLQSKIQRTWLSDRLEAVITHEVPAGQEVSHVAPTPAVR